MQNKLTSIHPHKIKSRPSQITIFTQINATQRINTQNKSQRLKQINLQKQNHQSIVTSNTTNMKFDTKNLSPIHLRPSRASSSSLGLDERDLVWRNPNKYIADEDQETTDYHCNENENENGKQRRGSCGKDRNSYGRRIEHLPRMVYTPVKISARTSQKRRSGTSPFTIRSVTEKEMDDLNASLINLSFCNADKNDSNNKNADENNNNNNPNSNTNARYIDTDTATATGDDGGDGVAGVPLMGRIPTNHIDSKTGKTTIVWRSARTTNTVGDS
jgi:hypothetical protein